MRLFHGVTHGQIGVDLVVVAPAYPASLYVPGGDKIGDDGLGGPFGDPDPVGDITAAHAGVFGDADENVAVVREEGPGRFGPRDGALSADVGIGLAFYHRTIVAGFVKQKA